MLLFDICTLNDRKTTKITFFEHIHYTAMKLQILFYFKYPHLFSK